MHESKWFLHPILILVSSIVAVALSLVLYIYWYMEASAGLKEVIRKTNIDPGQVLAPQTWVVILVLSILVGIILVGMFTIFVYNQKTFQLYRLQRNFINNFTHELKTPVTSLKLYLETFREHELARKDQLKYIGYMVQDADRLSHNINRILNLAKIESKAFSGQFYEQDLVKVVTQFYEENRHLFAECDIHIQNPTGRSFLFPVVLPLVEMLLMNLFTNAITYNESKTPRLDITFKPEGRDLHVQFEDNGIGFPRSEGKKLFKKFYQVGQSDDMSAKGTGIGLYLASSIARIHKWKIAAEPKEYSRGSVFSLILPFKISNIHSK